MHFPDLNTEVRALMMKEISDDIGSGRLYVGKRLSRKREPIPTFPGFAVSADIAASFWAERWTNGRVLIRGA